jgi:hypothetical protein
MSVLDELEGGRSPDDPGPDDDDVQAHARRSRTATHAVEGDRPGCLAAVCLRRTWNEGNLILRARRLEETSFAKGRGRTQEFSRYDQAAARLVQLGPRHSQEIPKGEIRAGRMRSAAQNVEAGLHARLDARPAGRFLPSSVAA